MNLKVHGQTRDVRVFSTGKPDTIDIALEWFDYSGPEKRLCSASTSIDIGQAGALIAAIEAAAERAQCTAA